MKKIKLNKMLDKKWKMSVSALLCIILLSIVFILKNDFVENGLKILMNSLNIYSEEVTKIVVKSESQNYDKNDGGSWKIEESVNWGSENTVDVHFNLNTVGKVSTKPKDYVVVLDLSASMTEDRFNNLKENMEELFPVLLSNHETRIALLGYNNTATVLSQFTSNKELLISQVERLESRGDTNYNAALKKVTEVLEKDNYKSDSNRDLVVLFFTDGYPNVESTAQVAEYDYLKETYANLSIVGIEYDIQIDGMIPELEEISNTVIRVDKNNLVDKLIQVVSICQPYDSFKMEYEINDTYFSVDESSMESSYGNVSVGSSNKKIIWDFSNELNTGTSSSLDFKLVLKSAYKDKEGFLNTNNKINISYKVNGEDKYSTVNSGDSPVLKRPYEVIYDVNIPYEDGALGCNIKENVVDKYSPYKVVAIRDKELFCSGYQFKGWEIAEESLKGLVRLNDEKFIMPSHDVVIRAIWSRIGLTKSMDGTVHKKHSLYEQMKNEVKKENGITVLAGTESTKYPIYYYTSNVEGGYKNNNNVIFANKCWKIIRSTETSGIKLIYNGVPDASRTCPYYGNGKEGLDAQLENVSAFHEKPTSSLADAGYMNNKKVDRNSKKMSTTDTLIRNLGSMGRTNYYYSDAVTYDYDTKLYTLVNATQFGQWSDHYNEVVSKGRYTCREEENNSCGTVYYIVGGNSTSTKYVTVAYGNDIDDYTLTFSNNYTGSNPYTLTNPVRVSYVDWFTNYKDYNNYYICFDYKTTSGCSNLYYVVATANNSITFVNMENKYKYGNSVKYENGVYTLTDDNASFKTFWDWERNYKSLNNNHYTCFNESGVCSEVYYLNYVTKSEALYLTLTGGNRIEDIMELMLGAGDSSSDLNHINIKENENYINKNDSSIKAVVDKWYEENMVPYTPYLEDTVFCNERGIESYGSWNPNGGSLTSSYLNFKASYSTGIICSKRIDRFTVSEELGNGDLTYPVGLLTYNEAVLVGGTAIRTGSSYWTMTPNYFESSDFRYNGRSWYVFGNGALDPSVVSSGYGVRPVVALRPGVEYTRGNGSYTNPYVVDIL